MMCPHFVSSGDQPHTSYKLLYHVMTLLKNCTEKAFELVIDLTHATSLNEPDVSVAISVHYCVHLHVVLFHGAQ